MENVSKALPVMIGLFFYVAGLMQIGFWGLIAWENT